MARKLPSEAYQLADTYQLGTPVRRHISLGWIILYSWMLVLFFLGWIGFTIAAFNGLNLLFVSCVELIFIGGIAIYASLLFNVCSRYAYECTDGFVEITRKTRQVRHALHWDEIVSTHVSGGGRSLPTYYVTDINNKDIEVPYHALWRRCKRAATNPGPLRRVRH